MKIYAISELKYLTWVDVVKAIFKQRNMNMMDDEALRDYYNKGFTPYSAYWAYMFY